MAGHAWPTSQCLTTTTGRPLHARLGRLAERVDSPTHVLAPICVQLGSLAGVLPTGADSLNAAFVRVGTSRPLTSDELSPATRSLMASRASAPSTKNGRRSSATVNRA